MRIVAAHHFPPPTPVLVSWQNAWDRRDHTWQIARSMPTG